MAAQPAKAYAASVNQASATANSITVSWDDQADGKKTIESYKVNWGPGYTYTNSITLQPNKTSHTLTGLNPGTKYSVRVYCTYVSSYGTRYTDSYVGSSTMATRVVKPTGVKQVKWYYYIKNVEFSWNKQDAATSVEWKVCKASNGKKVKGGTVSAYRTSDTASKISNNVVYTAQVRVKDAYGWSPWSDKAYLFTQPMLLDSKTKATNGKLNIA